MAPSTSKRPRPMSNKSRTKSEENQKQSDSDSLFAYLGLDMSVQCLLRCSRSEYGSIASLNRSFRSLIKSGRLFKYRHMMGFVEHWIYLSTRCPDWEAFDPINGRWITVPRMPGSHCFICADKESLGVGTELLVFGREILDAAIYKYSILTNSWSGELRMKTPRCLFASASLGEIAIVAGGCHMDGKISSVAELYKSDTGEWETLPNMKQGRKMCSGFFMDGKFYAIGGHFIEEKSREPKYLTCGEEYDLQTKNWRVIPNMFPEREGSRECRAPPPLVAVVKNVLYGVDCETHEMMKYDKVKNSWAVIEMLPPSVASMNGWGLAFRACGDLLLVIGGVKEGGASMEIYGWKPDEGAPQWNLLAAKHRIGSFVFNCTVMGC